MNKLYFFAVFFLALMAGQQMYPVSVADKGEQSRVGVPKAQLQPQAQEQAPRELSFVEIKNTESEKSAQVKKAYNAAIRFVLKPFEISNYYLAKLCPITEHLAKKGFFPCFVFALTTGLIGAGLFKFTDYKQIGETCLAASNTTINGFGLLAYVWFLSAMAEDFEIDH